MQPAVCHLVQRDSSAFKFDRVEIAYYLSFILLAELLTDEGYGTDGGAEDFFVCFFCSSVSQRQMCSDDFICCHAEIEVADQAFYLTQSQYADTRPTSLSADLRTPCPWQGSNLSTNFSS